MKDCRICDGRGFFEKPLDDEKFEEAFDFYDKQACFTLDETRKKALDYVGYVLVKCPVCQNDEENSK